LWNNKCTENSSKTL